MAVREVGEGEYLSMARRSIGMPSRACFFRHSCSVNLWIRLQTVECKSRECVCGSEGCVCVCGGEVLSSHVNGECLICSVEKLVMKSLICKIKLVHATCSRFSFPFLYKFIYNNYRTGKPKSYSIIMLCNVIHMRHAFQLHWPAV